MTISQLLKYTISLPKSIYFNFRVLPFMQALKFPFLVAYNVKLLTLKRNIIEFSDGTKLKPVSVAIGFNGTEEIAPQRALLNLKCGKIIFNGSAYFGEGCIIGVSNGGRLVFGKNFSANKNFFVSCNKEIVFGPDCMLGWNVHLFDATGHIIYHNSVVKESFKRIHIGNHVWICAESHILKGAFIPDNSVIAYSSIVTKEFKNTNSLYGGVPAKELQNNIQWGNFKDLA